MLREVFECLPDATQVAQQGLVSHDAVSRERAAGGRGGESLAVDCG